MVLLEKIICSSYKIYTVDVGSSSLSSPTIPSSPTNQRVAADKFSKAMASIPLKKG
jgi:hypothetical protein